MRFRFKLSIRSKSGNERPEGSLNLLLHIQHLFSFPLHYSLLQKLDLTDSIARHHQIVKSDDLVK